MAKYRCYVCHDPVTKSEHKKVKYPEEKWTECVINYLNLVHCTGPNDMFDEDGATVVCEECYKKAKEYCKEKGKPITNDFIGW